MPALQLRPLGEPVLQLTLERDALYTIDDAAGRCQYEGGRVRERGQHVADYACTRRVVFHGTDTLNTAMLTMTIFFHGSAPPECLTVQGAHDFASGKEAGSVSAASALFAGYIGQPCHRVGNTLTFG